MSKKVTSLNKFYFIGGGDYFGNNAPNQKFNDEVVELLRTNKVSESIIQQIANSVEEIYSMGYNNGYDCCEAENNEYL